MATPGQLVECIADSLGVPSATVAMHDRNLAEAGLRKKSGRGRSAARVGPEDAANLLIAVAAAPMNGPAVVSSVETLNWYARLRAVSDDGRPAGWPRIGFAALEALPAGHQAFQALSALIDAARTKEMQELELAIKNRGGYWSFVISFFAPFPGVELDWHASTGAHKGRSITVRYTDEVVPDDEAAQEDWVGRKTERFGAGLLRQTRWFHHTVIHDIGDLLADRPAYASRRLLYSGRSSKPSSSEA
jgi:hypothetical protein